MLLVCGTLACIWQGNASDRFAPFAHGAGHTHPPAEALSYFAGLSSLPKYCLTLSGLWFCTGVALDAARDLAPRRWQPWIPVPIAMAIPMYLVRPLWPICKSSNTATDFSFTESRPGFPILFPWLFQSTWGILDGSYPCLAGPLAFSCCIQASRYSGLLASYFLEAGFQHLH